MDRNYSLWRKSIFLSLVLITMMSCLSLPTGLKATPTPSAVPVGINGGNSVAGAGSSGNGGNGSGNSGSGNGSSSSNNNGAATPVPTALTPDVQTLPYAVKQIETLGHETIGGQVCSLTKPFFVNASAPRASWVFNFVPQDAGRGNWTYAYSIPSAGESHSASGTYSISPTAATDGTLLLQMSGSDHVVFKGFDGNIPARYQFDLVPSSNITC